MSVDYNVDYSNHTLLDNKSKYSKIYKLTEIQASGVSQGDLLLLKTPCGQYRLYMSIAAADEDNTLHLTRYSEIDFAKAGEISSDILSNESDNAVYPCGC